jgi:hypothetical protein
VATNRTIISIASPRIVGNAAFEEAAARVPGVISAVGPAEDGENRFEVDPEAYGVPSERRLRELIEEYQE